MMATERKWVLLRYDDEIGRNVFCSKVGPPRPVIDDGTALHNDAFSAQRSAQRLAWSRGVSGEDCDDHLWFAVPVEREGSSTSRSMTTKEIRFKHPYGAAFSSDGLFTVEELARIAFSASEAKQIEAFEVTESPGEWRVMEEWNGENVTGADR